MIILLLIIAAAVLLFYEILKLNISGALQFGLVVIEMLLVSQIFIRRYKMPSEMGLVLVKSKKGIELIDRLARNEKLFNFIADIGSSISYGLLSFIIMRKNTSVASTIIGLALLALLSFFVAPVALTFLLMIAGIGSAGKAVASAPVASTGDIGFYIVTGGLLLGGLFLFILGGIVYYGIFVFGKLVSTLFFGTNAMAQVAPGGDLLLPGVNLPFFEGIIALAIVMIVHEGAHAVLSRIAKVPIVSSGIVLFGIIPIGAFVEPDEKKLLHTEKSKQTRVLVAGPTANMITASILFIVFIALFFTTSGMREGALYIVSGLPNGTLVYEINNQPVDNINFTTLKLPNNSNVTLLTNRGEIVQATNGTGKMGLEFAPVSKDTIFARYTNPIIQFIYVVLGLCVALNFVVGTVNILPIPLFDGYRILDVNIKNKMIVKVISYAALFFFILNFLPKLFH